MDVAEPTTSTAPPSSLSTAPTGPGAHDPETGPPTDMSTATSVAPTSLHDDSMNAMDAHYQPPPAANSNGASQSQAPPTVNTAAVAAVSAPSSAMTPTTTNYGVGGTLTPLGDDKVNTTATQKPKATKKKATADGDAPKKPSPRVRTPTVKGEKAEKKKAATARSTPTSGNGPTAPPTTAPANQMPPTSAGYPPQNGTTPDASGANRQELVPAQDIELRKTYLQNIYRQLQMTHRNQDDAAVRQLATSIEIDLCTRAKTRSEYISLMNQQIHSLMQAELTNGSVGLQSSLYVPGHGPAVSSSMGQHEATSTATGTSQVSTSTPTYSQHGHPGYPPTSTPMNQQRPPQSNQGSFMSLLSSQAPVQSFDSSRQQHPFPPTQGRPPQYGAPNSYPGQPGPQTVGPKGEPGAPTTQPSVPAYPDQRSGPQTPTSAPPEFAAQFQRLDRNGLLDLLWTQHKTVVQYQRRLAQLEMQLGARQPSPTGMMSNPSVPPNAYYNASPRPPVGGGGVPPSLSAEAEAQRANDRRNSRPGQMPTAAYGSAPQGQPQYPVPSQMPATPTGVQNPALYWEKVRYLKDTFLRPLCLAHQALSQHNAPSSSIQSQKAENVKHNISLACSILSETPKNVQPRPIDVIDSIERFIHSTVVPIVRKVNPQAVMQPPSGGPGFGPGAPTNGQQTPRDMTDVTRNSMEMKASPQVPSPSVGGVTQPGEPATAKGKAGASKPAAKPRKNPAASTKKSTPKATTPKAPKATAKKSPKQTPSKQAQPTVPQESAGVPQLAESTSTSADKGMLIENPAEDQSAIASMRSGAITDDENLNDFADFADLDFGDDLPDPLTKVQNKENAVGSNSRKRSIEDV